MGKAGRLPSPDPLTREGMSPAQQNWHWSVTLCKGALHPGDLKGAVSNMMVEVLTKIGAEIKSRRALKSIVKAAEEGATAIDGTLIRDGKVTDYPDALQAGQRISHWWCEVDRWLAGCMSKALTKTVRKNTIRWTVGVVFDWHASVHVIPRQPQPGDNIYVLGFNDSILMWKISDRRHQQRQQRCNVVLRQVHSA
jgi:hypothetical protein